MSMEESIFFRENKHDKKSANGEETGSGKSSTGNGENQLNDQQPNPMELNHTLNTTIEELKKNLSHEEEFRSINHSEPIHIFLKLKPLSHQELLKQDSKVIICFFR